MRMHVYMEYIDYRVSVAISMSFFRHQDKLATVLQNEALLLYSMGKLY